MGFDIETSVPVLTVFLQGILSFFSPCVLPLVPLYIGYLAGGTKTIDPDGTIRYDRKKVLVNTLFFVLGVSFAFFVLGLGFTALGRFFSGHRTLLARIGGVLIIAFGLFQLGIFHPRAMERERRLPMRLNKWSMNPLVALVVGFTFSFAWTPCVGPALASVLLMATSASSSAAGFALIGVYTLGFILPFLAVGLFTGTLLGFFKKHQKVVKYTVKVGGVLMILMGVMMITGWMNGLTGYLSSFGGNGSSGETQGGGSSSASDASDSSTPPTTAPSKTEDPDVIPAPDFTLTDQYGRQHKLSDYRGQVVFLNFWATWCDPCRREMPDIEDMYKANGKNTNDLVVLGVANPKTKDHPYNQDGTVEDVAAFLSDNGYTYPVAMDTTGDVFDQYYVSSFPTTFMIDREGNIFGYVQGTLTKSMMEDIVRQTMEGKRSK